MATAVPSLIGRRYILGDEIGHGGMGVVYEAVDRLTGQHVALKRVTASSDQLLMVARQTDNDPNLGLAREFQTLASLRHPNVIGVLDYGFDLDRQPFFTMDLLPRAQTILEAGQLLAVEAQIELLIQMFRALTYVHRRGVLHRDLKPGNVLVIDGQVKVLDFGLAIEEHTHGSALDTTTTGTVPYMAPEIVDGGNATVASDIYSAGVIAYELLIGRYPFDMSDVETLINGIRQTVPDTRSARLTPYLSAVLSRLLEKIDEDRYADAPAVIDALRRAMAVPPPPESAAIRESFLQASDLIERETEVGQLSKVLNAALVGEGSAWLIGGESGVGKSRLLSEINTRAMIKGTFALRGQTVSEGGMLYELWREIVRWLTILSDVTEREATILKAIVPDLAELLQRPIGEPPLVEPKTAQTRLFQTVELLFRRQTQPTVVILEDLHWAGSESLALLNYLSRIVNELPLLLIASYRSDERDDLPQILPAMPVMQLQRLSPRGVAALSASMLGSAGENEDIIALLQRETEGNAFFIVETVRALAEEAGQLDRIGSMTLPTTVSAGGVRGVVQRRLDRIPKADRGWLNIAAVYGRQVNLNLLSALGLIDQQETWLTLCSHAYVLDGSGGDWRFAHDKLREVLIGDLSITARRDLHRRVGSALETLPGTVDQQAAALGYHFWQGQVWDKAARYSLQAGDQAAKVFGYTEANQLYSQAIDALIHLPDSADNRRARVDSTIKLMNVSTSILSAERGKELLNTAQDLLIGLSTDGDEQRRGHVLFWLGRNAYYQGALKEAIALYQQALIVGQKYNDPQLIAIPGSVIGQTYALRGEYAKSLPLVHAARGPLEALGNWEEWMRAATYEGFDLVVTGHCAEGMALCEQALDRAMALNHFTAMQIAHTMISFSASIMEDDLQLYNEAEMTHALAERHDSWLYVYIGYAFQALGASRLGNHSEAEDLMARSHQALERLKGTAFLLDLFTRIQAEMALNAGDFAGAIRLAQETLALAGPEKPAETARAYLVWGRALFAQGQAQWNDAEAQMMTVIQMFEQNEMVVELAHAQRLWGEACFARQDLVAARSHWRKALERYQHTSLIAHTEQVEKLLARVAKAR